MLRAVLIATILMIFSNVGYAQDNQAKRGIYVTIRYEGSLHTVTHDATGFDLESDLGLTQLLYDSAIPEIWNATSDQNARYMLDITVSSAELERCPYTDGFTLIREQIHVQGEITDTVTGRLVASKAIEGELPADCPPERGFNNSIDSIYGKIANPKKFQDWLVSALENLPDLVITSTGNVVYGKLIAMDPSTLRIATSSERDGVRVYDLHSGAEVAQLGAEGYLTASFNGDGSLILTTDLSTSVVSVWNVVSGQIVAQLAHDENVQSAFFSPDSRFVVTTTEDPNEDHPAVYVWDAASGKQVAKLSPIGRLTSASIAPEGRYVVTISQQSDDNTNSMHVWDVALQESIAELSYDSATDVRAIFSPDGKFILVTTQNNWTQTSAFHIWDTESKAEIAWTSPVVWASSAVFSPDGSSLVTYNSSSDEANIWNIDSQKMITEIHSEGAYGIRMASFSPDGSTIFTETNDDALQVRDAKTGAIIAEQQFSDEQPDGGAFGSDGQTVIIICSVWSGGSGGNFTVLHTWNYVTGDQTELTIGG